MFSLALSTTLTNPPHSFWTAGKTPAKKTARVSYTPFFNNRVVPGKEAYMSYYYVGLRKITVGGQRVKIPRRYLKPDTNGTGGTITDSGTTFTVMARGIFESVSREFVRHGERHGYKRAKAAEVKALFRCFREKQDDGVPGDETSLQGGADVALLEENQYYDTDSVICMTLMSAEEVLSGGHGPEVWPGPSIVLGSFHMQNFYLEYDMQNQRLGSRKQKCN